MMRVIANHVALVGVDEPQRVCQWLREIALTEGAEGWACAQADCVEAWFEGSPPAVEAMLTWCRTHDATAHASAEVSTQRPCLKGGFEILDEVPGI